MASVTMTEPAPVELPTKRNSYYSSKPLQDIHSPSWIPILHSADIRSSARIEPTSEKELSPYNNSTFAPLTNPSSNLSSPRPTRTSSLSKSSVPPGTFTTELEAPLPKLPPVPVDKSVNVELPATRPQSRYFEKERKRRDQPAEDGQDTTDTEATADSSARDSARATSVGTASLLDHQIFNLAQPSSSKEELEIPAFPVAITTSAQTARKSQNIPTSKYSRKPLPSTSRIASAAPSQTQTPLPSPKISPAPAPLSRQPSERQLTRPPSPQQPPTQPPTPSASRRPSTSNALQAAKSTASQRRQRALNSHPSNISLKSRRNSSSDDAESVSSRPSLPRPSLHKPRKSTDSRTTPRLNTYDLPTPTPAPTTPLPDLPPHARTPNASVSSTPILPSTATFTPVEPMPKPVPSAHLPAPRPPPTPRLEHTHAEMASFMTASNTVIFRRFDEVHVQLLLSLQDEITQLERGLMKLDNAKAEGQGERLGERTRVLRELRRVVGEYDHLFSSWSQMQASKVSKSTANSLRQWLERPSTSAGAGLGTGAKEDLEWLEKNGKDLSSVAMDGEKGRRRANSRGTGSGGGSGVGGAGGLMGLFGPCVGKRK